MNFSKEVAEKILLNQIDANTLSKMYPDIKESVIKDFSKINNNSVDEISNFVNTYKTKSSFAINKINKNKGNLKTLNTFLPDIIRARIAINFLEQMNFAVQSGEYSGKVRFNLLDGLILQKLLFKKGLERKQVSIKKFKLIWHFVIKKKVLIPLVNKKGIYCFYSKELVKEISKLVCNQKCLEIGAGDGTLTRFLKDEGISCIATDNYSWENYIKYPEFVERMDARSAIEKYKPDVVICSWPPTGNNFEKHVFSCESVKLYIVIGATNHANSGNHDIYQSQRGFTMEFSEHLSSFVLPQSKDNAVYIFRRK